MLALCLNTVLLVLSAAAQPAEPGPHPSGMDLLYDDHIPVMASGEPIVTLGILSGEEHVRLRADVTVEIDFFEAGVAKHVVLQPGEQLAVRLQHARAATRQPFVDLQGVDLENRTRLPRVMAAWRNRGVADVSILEEGTVLEMAGRVLDNRAFRVIAAVPSAAAAAALSTRLNRRFGARTQVRERLAERPWGDLDITTAAGPVGTAASYVRFVPEAGGAIEIADVEFGRGYAWHGHEDRAYRGEIYVVVDPNGKLAAVNAIGVETMLAGVVPAELFPTAPPEALKAQAIAARNTLFAKLGRRHRDVPFHLCSEQHCQVYAGVTKEDPRTTAAVQATAGQALFLQGTLVDAVYSSSCGGYTEDNETVWGDTANPALRSRPDFPESAAATLPFAVGLRDATMPAWVGGTPTTYCSKPGQSRADKFRWQKSFDADGLNATVTKVYSGLGKLRDLVVRQRGRGGRIARLELIGARKRVVVSRELPIRQLFGNLNSAAFVIDRQKDAAGFLRSVTFRGAGWGHGVGLCQLGAVGRAESGQEYRDILAYYYSGAQIETLYGPPAEVPAEVNLTSELLGSNADPD